MSIRRLPGHTVNIDPIYPRIPRNFEDHTHAMNVHDHYACAEFARALEYIDMMIFTKYFHIRFTHSSGVGGCCVGARDERRVVVRGGERAGGRDSTRGASTRVTR